MSNFSNTLKLTLNGSKLLTAALSGKVLTFTKMAMGDGTLNGSSELLVDLVSKKQELAIIKCNRKGTQVTLGAVLRMSDIIDSFAWKELGIYAQGEDGEEILFMYGNCGEQSSYITSEGLNEKTINVTIIVGDSPNITAIIDNSLVYLTYEDLEMHDKDPEAHKPIRDWVQGLFDSVKHTWDGITGKPDTFPPSKHNHSKSEITDFEHNHDERYYTETESDERFATKNHGTHVSYGTGTTGITYGGTAEAGSATTVSRSDHKHALPALPVGSVNEQGIVQLNNTVTSTSTTEAGTAHAVKMAYDKGVEAYEYASRSVIKSVQKGSVVMGQNNYGYARITISPIDVNKAFLLVDSNPSFSMTNVSLAVGQILSPTLIEIQQGTTGGTYSNSAYWQVIEFY